ncbi:MAG TPA: hypothetical protein VIY08_10050 [Candidatus Nitrosocosmicus sp.]
MYIKLESVNIETGIQEAIRESKSLNSLFKIFCLYYDGNIILQAPIYYKYRNNNNSIVIEHKPLMDFSHPLFMTDLTDKMQDPYLISIYKRNLEDLHPLEQKIKKNMDILGLIDKHTPIGLKFTLVVIALESLLVTGSRENYRSISHELKEKVCLLMGACEEYYSFIIEKRLNKNIKLDSIDQKKIIFHKESKIYTICGQVLHMREKMQ